MKINEIDERKFEGKLLELKKNLGSMYIDTFGLTDNIYKDCLNKELESYEINDGNRIMVIPIESSNVNIMVMRKSVMENYLMDEDWWNETEVLEPEDIDLEDLEDLNDPEVRNIIYHDVKFNQYNIYVQILENLLIDELSGYSSKIRNIYGIINDKSELLCLTLDPDPCLSKNNSDYLVVMSPE